MIIANIQIKTMIPAPSISRPFSEPSLLRGFTRVCHHLRWNHPYCQGDPGRDKDQVIQVAQHGYEIGDQVDRT